MGSEVWVCEYSPTQGCFHIDTLERTLEVNRQSIASGLAVDYILLHIALSSEEAHDFTEQWKAKYGQ